MDDFHYNEVSPPPAKHALRPNLIVNTLRLSVLVGIVVAMLLWVCR